MRVWWLGGLNVFGAGSWGAGLFEVAAGCAGRGDDIKNRMGDKAQAGGGPRFIGLSLIRSGLVVPASGGGFLGTG